MGGVEEVLLAVVVGRGGYDHEVRIPVCRLAVEGCLEVEGLLRQVFLYVFVLDGRYTIVDFFYFLRYDVHRSHMMVLREESRYAEADVSGAGYHYVYICCFHNRFQSGSHEKAVAIPLISAEVYFCYKFSIFCSFRV